MFVHVLRRGLVLLGVGIAVAVSLTPAEADGIESQGGSTNASVGNGQVVVGASVGGSPGPGIPGQGGPNAISCWDEWITGDAASILGTSSPASGGWVLPHCTDANGNVLPTTLIWVSAAQLNTLPSANALGRQAVSRLPLSQGFIRMAPASTSEQIVGARTWLWLDPAVWHTYTATAAAGPVTATATAVPARVDWNMGDGHTVSCPGPGKQYDPSAPDASQSTDCAYAWPRSSAGQSDGTYTVTATIYWHVTWVAQGATGGGDLGIVAGPASQAAVRVGEVQAVNKESGQNG